MRKIIFAALVAATPALAQEPPTTIQAATVAGLGTTAGDFDRTGDVDRYRFPLKKGKDYALGVSSADALWTLRGPTGTTLWSGVAGQGAAGGFEFRAGREGYFAVEGKAYEVGGYEIRLHADCRDDAKTRCRIASGTTQRHTLAWGGDRDWVRLGSSAGTVTAKAEFDPLTLRALDSGGKLLASGVDTLTFKGAAYLEIRAEDDLPGRRYTLEMR